MVPERTGCSHRTRSIVPGVLRAVFTDNKTQLGEAILSAKLDLLANAPAHSDLGETYHLFGDPAMALNLTIRPWPYGIHLPLLTRNYPETERKKDRSTNSDRSHTCRFGKRNYRQHNSLYTSL